MTIFVTVTGCAELLSAAIDQDIALGPLTEAAAIPPDDIAQLLSEARSQWEKPGHPGWSLAPVQPPSTHPPGSGAPSGSAQAAQASNNQQLATTFPMCNTCMLRIAHVLLCMVTHC